jgi:tetratricopeptide (TPR) repeat protein
MSLAEEGLWCGAAATLLTCCILRPPLGNTTEDEDLRKYLLPHVDHVRLCQKSIDKRMEDKRERDKRMARMKLWPVFDDGFNREKAIMYAKFSIVYSQNGLWKEAKRLQQAVKDFTFRVLGLEHVMTRAITLALAGTLFNLGKSDDAAVLQEQVLKACIDHLGPEHHETLVAKCTLGDSRYLQGRFSDAKALQEEAGLKKLHGLLDEDTLHAIDYLGRTVLMFYSEDDIKRARELHLTAVEGMRKVHGRDHLRTLIACENLCTTAVRSGDQAQLHEAHEMMIEVFETRRKKLGREHGYTLLAQVNLANIKAALGKLEEADNLIQLSLPIAERNLGPDHHACLWGRCQLGKIWVQQKRWVEAVGLLVDVTGRQHSLLQGRGRYHPDRLSGLADLAAAYNALGKFEECDKVVSEVLDGFNRITTSEHPFARKVKEDWEKWVEERGNKSGDSSLS